MFHVIYTAFYGKTEVIGTFDTIENARNYMKADVEYNIINAKNNGVTYTFETLNENAMMIPEYGKWEIANEYRP